MIYLAVLSGEHPTLPLSELRAVVELSSPFRVVERDGPITVFEADEFEWERLAMTHAVMKHLATWDGMDVPVNALSIPEGSFAVRPSRHMGEGRDLDVDYLVREVGRALSRCGKVDLENPQTVLRLEICRRVHAGILLWERDKREYESRKPQNRPFFSPISIHPRLARALVNLSRVRRGETLLDPFCGTGGILIEAGLVGAVPLGVDSDAAMVVGATWNLRWAGVSGRVEIGDVSHAPDKFGKVDAVATDPPYGQASTLNKEERDALYIRAFTTIADVLKRGRYAAMVLPDMRYVEMGSEYLEFLEVHPYRVHRSLTRYFTVYRSL